MKNCCLAIVFCSLLAGCGGGSTSEGEKDSESFTVGGTVTGLSGTLVLQNNGADDLTLTNNGAFTFATPIEQGSDYDVTVKTQPTGQTCTVSLGTGTNVSADVTSIGVVCTTNTISFTNEVQPIFTANCASCHVGGGSSGGLQLDAAVSYGNLVNKPSSELPTMDRIEPNDPANSYLLHKLKGTQGTVSGSGTQMPQGRPPLTTAQISTIETWISQGAPQ